MELYETQGNFIILNGEDSLWCNREDGGLLAKVGADLTQAWKPVCRGRVYGVIGKIQFFPGSDWRLLVISKQSLLGSLPGKDGKIDVYRIDRVAVLPLSSGELCEVELEYCEEHQSGGRPRKLLGGAGDGQQKGLGQTWRTALRTAATNIKGNVKTTNMKDREFKDKEKLERRFSEELLKMFNDTECFYYSPTGDLTNSLQKQFSNTYNSSLPAWKRNNDSFFWNKFMLQDLINSEDPLSSKWIVAIIQGYCEITHCQNTFDEEDMEGTVNIQNLPLPPEEFDLVILSRRSVCRAGTRYRRRGVDENGDVANYVETEQIICTASHNVSFVQVRGSVPVYWSQPGYKYRPPPRLDKDDRATQTSFKKHFDHQLELFKSVVVISLVDKSGREKIIADAFMDHILHYNSALLTYVTFDFHEYCRGMKFENVSVLVESIVEIIKDMRYCWTDSKGIICEQRSVFRTNCMDCLDRTNVVQAAVARHVIEVQLRKLGKLLPDQSLPASVRTSFQDMWANNGDAISLQYAGTAAMKGDFTRTGERKFTGLMKDGYNSANRYYLNRFKAAYRQTLIDLMLGNPPTEDISALIAAMGSGSEEEQWTMEREECVVQLVEYCHQLLLTEDEECLGGWALVDPFYSPDGETDVILLLTFEAYYVASYDDEAEKVTQYERILLDDVEKIEIGHEPTVFKSKYLFIRIHRKFNGASGYFHTLRMIQHRSPEDARSVLRSIADAFATARENLSQKIMECRLDKKKSKAASEIIQISSKSCLSGWTTPSLALQRKREARESCNDDDHLRMLARSRPKSRTSSLSSSYSDPCLVLRKLDYADDFKIECNSAPLSSAENSDEEGYHKTEDTGLDTTTLCTVIERVRVVNDVLEEDAWAKIEGAFENLEKDEEDKKMRDRREGCENDGDDEHEQEKAGEGEEAGLANFVRLEFKQANDDGNENVAMLPPDEDAWEGVDLSRDQLQNVHSTNGGGVEWKQNVHSTNGGGMEWSNQRQDMNSTKGGGVEWSNQRQDMNSTKGGGVEWNNQRQDMNSTKGGGVEWSNQRQDMNSTKGGGVEWSNQRRDVHSTEGGGVERTEDSAEMVALNVQESCDIEGAECFGGGEQNIEGTRLSAEPEENRPGNYPEGELQLNAENWKDEEGTVDIDCFTTTASLKLHGSSSGSEDHESNERRISPEPTDRSRRFTDRFRIPGNRSPKLNIFATAQARGKNIIPDLRNKLSSFSQQMRNRGSPRLGFKRGFPNDSALEQKMRRLKCRTKIIEL